MPPTLLTAACICCIVLPELKSNKAEGERKLRMKRQMIVGAESSCVWIRAAWIDTVLVRDAAVQLNQVDNRHWTLRITFNICNRTSFVYGKIET